MANIFCHTFFRSVAGFIKKTESEFQFSSSRAHLNENVLSNKQSFYIIRWDLIKQMSALSSCLTFKSAAEFISAQAIF